MVSYFCNQPSVVIVDCDFFVEVVMVIGALNDRKNKRIVKHFSCIAVVLSRMIMDISRDEKGRCSPR